MDRPRLSHWVARFRADGLAGLADGRDPWRVDLTTQQLGQLRKWATERVGWATWSSSADLSERIEREFDVFASPVTIQEILREKCGLLWSAGRWREP
jgi:transposase